MKNWPRLFSPGVSVVAQGGGSRQRELSRLWVWGSKGSGIAKGTKSTPRSHNQCPISQRHSHTDIPEVPNATRRSLSLMARQVRGAGREALMATFVVRE